MTPPPSPPDAASPTLDAAEQVRFAEERIPLVLALLVALAVGVPIATALLTGAFWIPHNDDWAYSKIALHLAEHGELRLVGWNQPSLIGQVVWTLPFTALLGPSLWVLHVSQAIAAAVALVLTYLVARRFLASEIAVLVTALIATFPGYALLSTTFMTDTTAFAAEMGCLLLGLLALEHGPSDRLSLGLSLAIGFFAFTIREISLAAPLAVLAGRYVALPRRSNRIATAQLAFTLFVAAGVFFFWRQSLPGGEQPWLLGTSTWYMRFEQVVRAFFTGAFGLFPLLLLTAVRVRRQLLSLGAVVAASAVFLLGAITILHERGAPFTLFIGNALTRFGAFWETLPGRPLLFSRPVWWTMTLVALFAGIALAALLAGPIADGQARRLPSQPEGSPPEAGKHGSTIVLATYAGLVVVSLLLRAAAGTSGLYDRYLWGLALVAAIAVGRKWPSGAATPLRVSYVGVACLAVISLVLVLDEQTSSIERWRAGKAAISSRVAATDIDAGFEWMGWHYPYVVGSYKGPPRWHKPATWYNLLKLQGAANCILMAYSPRTEPWLEPVETRTYRNLLVAGSRTLYVYRNPPACS